MCAQNLTRTEHDRPSAVRSIASVLDGLPKAEIQRLAVEIILENRRRLDHAQTLFDRLETIASTGEDRGGLERLRRDYILAQLRLSSLHDIVSAMIDALGYVPDLPAGPSQSPDIPDLD